MTRNRRYEPVTCPDCGEKVGATNILRHRKGHKKEPEVDPEI
jgi:hypothetical protein